jgi:glycosyltransferase involved in cell wall biosynthesis
MEVPLISVVIPTCNSADVLADCLLSIRNQDYPQDKIEIIVVDCFSKDGTSHIAKRFRARVFFAKCGPLGARKIGFEKSLGDLILFLDSDQMLKTRDCLMRAVALSDKYDFLHFEEFSLPPRTWLQLLLKMDTKIRQEVSYNLSGLEGVLFTRFFKRHILDKVFRSIPPGILYSISEHEDAVLHWEAHKVSNKMGTVKDAVWHRDPKSLLVFWKKMYRYGKSGNVVKGWYDQPISYKQAFRIKQIIRLLKQPWKAAPVAFLLMLKTVPYMLGQIIGF